MDCLDCKYYTKCRDKNKSINYSCDNFEPREVRDFSAFLSDSPKNNNDIDMSDVEGENKLTTSSIIIADEKTDVAKLIEDIINSEMLTPVDTKLDDSSLPHAKNFFEFSTGQDFLSVKPYVKQMLYMTQLYAEYCPRCSDTKWMKSGIKVDDSLAIFLTKVQLLEYGVCPKCHATKSDLFLNGELNIFHELAGLAGQRSGKSAVTSMGSAYLTHKQLKMQKPNEVYGLLPSNVLHGTFVALTYKQAAETLWEPYLAYITDSPWFREYHNLMSYYGNKYNDEFFKIKDTFILYKNKRILVYPSGPNKKTLRGRCLVGSTVVNTEYGFLRLDELILDQGYIPASFTISSPLGAKNVTYTYKDFDKTIRLITKNGFTIEGTQEHPLLVLNSQFDLMWKSLDEIQLGDLIVSKTKHTSVLYAEDKVSLDYAIDLGYTFDLNLEENLPFDVRTSSKNLITKFLKSLFSVNLNNNILVAKHKSVVSQLQNLLLMIFDIVSKVSENDSLYYLTIHRDFENFEKAFGITIEGVPEQDQSLFNFKASVDIEILNAYAHYEEVISIDFSSDKSFVYDVTVPDGHSFMANGLASHNTRFLSAIDEIGWFNNNKDEAQVKMDANEVYVALDRSLLTVRSAANRLLKQGYNDVPTGMAFNVSSPSSARDKITELVTQSKNSKKIFGFKCATWEMNPNITKEDLSEEFAKDPQAAERDYGCNPPLSDSAFFSSFASIEGCFIGKPNKLVYNYAQRKAKDGSLTRFAKIVEVSKSTKPNILAIDAGYCITGDSLIHLESGLVRIDSISSSSSVNVPIDLVATGRYDKIKLKTWHYMGKKPTIKLSIESGHEIKGTLNHRQLVLRNGVHSWVRLCDIKVGDFVCFHSKSFNDSNQVYHNFFSNSDISIALGNASVHHCFIRYAYGNLNSKEFQVLLNYNGIMTDLIDGVLLPSTLEDQIKLESILTVSLNLNKPKHRIPAELMEHYAGSIVELLKSAKSISIDELNSPELKFILSILQQFSEKSYDSLISQLSTMYHYRKVISIEDNGEQDVYDLSVEEGKEPAYVANGMIIHNTNNSFSLVCGHLHEGIPVLTCFCEVIPNPGVPLNHSLIFKELIYPLIVERNVKVLISDRWQNIKLLQDAELEFDDLITTSYSLKYDDFWILKQSMFDGEVILPKLKRSIDDILKYDQSKYPHCFTDPIEHLALQIMTVRDLGNTVDKGESLTDDTFRAMALAIFGLTSDDYLELFSGDGIEDMSPKSAIGVTVSKSGGGISKGEVGKSTSGKAIGMALSRR